MSDLYRKQLQPLYDYCRSVLPQFALAIRDADDEIERLKTINKALMDALDAAIDYTIMRDRETYAALEDAITAATEAYDARQI